MSLVAAVAPHTTARTCQHYSTCQSSCLCSPRRAEAPALYIPMPASPGCFSRIHSEVPAGQRHKELCQHRSSAQNNTAALQRGGFLSALAQKPLVLSECNFLSPVGGEKPTQAFSQQTLLLNMIALWFSNRAGDEATLSQRGNRTAT